MIADSSSTGAVHRRATRSGALVSARAILQGAAGMAGVVTLSRLFQPHDFGFLAVMWALVDTISLVGDLGFGMAIVRSREIPPEDDYETVFFVHLTTTVVMVVIAFLIAAPLSEALLQSQAAAWPLRIGSLALFGRALGYGAMPNKMERELVLHPIVTADIVETVCFYGTAAGLGLLGAGIWAFAVAMCIRSFAAVPVIYWYSRRFVVPRFHRESALRLYRFALVFWAGYVASSVRDSVTPILVVAIAGPVVAGYFRWSTSILAWPVSIFRSVGQVSLPAFARLEDDTHAYRRATAAATNLLLLSLIPMTVAWAGFGPVIVPLVFGKEWLDAQPLSAVMLAGFAISSAFTVAAANAVTVRHGPGRVLFAHGAHTVALWCLGLPLLAKYGPLGFGAGWVAAHVVLAGLLVGFCPAARPTIRSLLTPTLASAAGVAGGLAVLGSNHHSVVGLLAAGVVAVVLGVAVIVLVGQKEITLVKQVVLLALSPASAEPGIRAGETRWARDTGAPAATQFCEKKDARR